MNKKSDGGMTIISSGTTIVGDIVVEEDIRVDGSIKGSLKSSGELVVTDKGSIEGEIEVGSAVVAGQINGNLTAIEKTVLEPHSQLRGDLRTRNLVIAEGARFHGNCAMNGRETD